MKIVSSLLVATTFCLSGLSLEATMKYERFEADPSQFDKPTTIKVLLDKGENSPLLEVKGPYMVYDAKSGFRVSSGSNPKRDFVTYDAKGLKWGHSMNGASQIRIVPSDIETTIVLNGTQYRGCIEIYNVNGKFLVINETDMETYLKSTLNTQFSDEVEEETMEAVAVAARTMGYFLVSRSPYAKWHVEAKDVGYQGYGATLQNLMVDRAIDNTRHVIMTYKDAPFATAWTRNCAGKTADFTALYRKNINAPKGVEIPMAQSEKEQLRWTHTISKKEMAKSLDLKAISSLDLFVDKASAKVYGVRIIDGDQARTLDFIAFQKKLGEKKIRSSDFTVSMKGDSIVFTGYGDGPGVGLCLYTANKMAEKGEKAPKILSTFFPETKIEKTRNLPAPGAKVDKTK
ncbi:MAG: SpoIID/LytB domain-containing protein [Chlamydiales bacterium]|nr:SpoIID/LytB domain-containing protein [Chlamydiales bacterium]